MNGESFRLAASKKDQRRHRPASNPTPNITFEGDANPRGNLNHQGFTALFSQPDRYTFTPPSGTFSLRP